MMRWVGSVTLAGVVLVTTIGCHALETNKETHAMATVEYLNPEGLHRNPAFSQAVTVEGPHRVVYVGGQNAVDSSGNIVGPQDLAAQSEQVARNLKVALEAGGADLEHVIKWTVYLVAGQPPRPAFEAFQRVFGPLSPPPTISVLQVAGLAHPEFLLEVEAVAVVPR